MIISLIGMSGSGKSYWARKLSHSAGYRHIYVDRKIMKQLYPTLEKYGHVGIESAVNDWMGQPYDSRYLVNCKKYLELEEKIMDQILTKLENGKYKEENIVIDTAGSLVHLKKDLWGRLKNQTTVILLDATDEVRDKLWHTFLADPKPLVWDKFFNQNEGEENKQALARCYPILLDYRLKIYRELADVILDFEEIRAANFTVDDFLSKIKKLS